jgi:hypothetical protein
MGDTSSSGSGNYAPANWMAFTQDGTTPAASDATLLSEITSGALARAQAVYAHTTGAQSYTLTRVITADEAVTLRKLGVFNADSPGGTLVFEALIPDAPILQPGDTIQITHTITL